MNVPTYRIRVRVGENELEVEGDKEFVTETCLNFRNGFLNLPLQAEYQTNETVIAGNAESGSDTKVPLKTADTTFAPFTTNDKPDKDFRSIPSLTSFIKKRQPKSHPDIVLVIATYLYQYKGILSFTKAEIEQCYREALLSKSANISQDINRNRKKGYIDLTGEERDSLKTFYVTQDGIDYVASMLKGEV
jgi:hypothetical protein